MIEFFNRHVTGSSRHRFVAALPKLSKLMILFWYHYTIILGQSKREYFPCAIAWQSFERGGPPSSLAIRLLRETYVEVFWGAQIFSTISNNDTVPARIFRSVEGRVSFIKDIIYV